MGHVVLVGLMGSGKTTVGEALAAALGVPRHDSDADIERDTGLRGRDLAARQLAPVKHRLQQLPRSRRQPAQLRLLLRP